MWLRSNDKTSRREQQRLLPETPQHLPSTPRKVSPEELREQTARHDQFLRESLEITDTEVLQQAPQTIGPVLAHLLDPKRPVLEVKQFETKSNYHVLKSEERDLAHLLALGQFLLEHNKPREAFGVLATTLLHMEKEGLLDHLHMEPLLQTCGQALQRAAPQHAKLGPSPLVQRMKEFAEKCADRHGHLRQVLPLFFPPRTNEAKASCETFLRALQANDEQCLLVQNDPPLCEMLDTLLSRDSPRFAVTPGEHGFWIYTIPSGTAFHEVAALAERLLALKVPGAVNLLTALALAAGNEGAQTEIQRFRACCQALLQAPAGSVSSQLWQQLAPRVCELADQQQLKIEDLKDFERAAQSHADLNAEAQFCRQRLRLRLEELKRLKDPHKRKTLALQLMNEIGQAHQTLRRIKTAEDNGITFMVALCDMGRRHHEGWLNDAEKVLQALLQSPD